MTRQNLFSLPARSPTLLMPPEADSVRSAPLTARRCLRIARLCGLAVVVLGLCVLVGWAGDFRPLMTLLPGLVAMKPNTAVALCLGGLSLFLSSQPPDERRRRRSASTLLAALMAAIGALTLAEYALNVNFGLDELLWRDYAVSRAPGRISLRAASLPPRRLAIGRISTATPWVRNTARQARSRRTT